MAPLLKVFISGASSGIGEALARHYANQGATLGLAARRQDLLQQLAAEFSSPVSIYPLDVRDSPALQSAAQDFISRHGVPDIIIANAGIGVGNLTQHVEDLQRFQDTLDINVMGMVKTFQPFVAPMREKKSGTLVGIASIAGYRGMPGSTAYNASKAAAISYLEGLRVELHGSGVRVCTICPGFINTPMTQKNPFPMPFIISADSAAKKFARAIAQQRSHVTIPWQMAGIFLILRHLPNWAYDRVFAKTTRKPRKPA
ncbi:MAG: SDR family oxidoreductase [Burkholderiales bacterium]